MQLILVNQNSWLQIDFLFYFSLPLALCHVNDDRVFGATLKKKLISVILRLNSKYYFKKKGKPKLLPQLLQATLYKMWRRRVRKAPGQVHSCRWAPLISRSNLVFCVSLVFATGSQSETRKNDLKGEQLKLFRHKITWGSTGHVKDKWFGQIFFSGFGKKVILPTWKFTCSTSAHLIGSHTGG